jgi:hypothetical protein
VLYERKNNGGASSRSCEKGVSPHRCLWITVAFSTSEVSVERDDLTHEPRTCVAPHTRLSDAPRRKVE